MYILQRSILFLLLTASIIGCATPLQMSLQGNEPLFRGHTTAVVMTFQDISDPVGNTDEQRKAYKDTLQAACKTIAEYITQELIQKKAYSTVLKDQPIPPESTIIISGFIRKYDKGNAALRYFIGLGAGSSVFHATIEFKDSQSGKILGTISNNGTSWVGGGVIASGQSVEVLMQDAARHVATELIWVRQKN